MLLVLLACTVFWYAFYFGFKTGIKKRHGDK